MNRLLRNMLNDAHTSVMLEIAADKATQNLDDICKCGHLRGEHFRRVCTMEADHQPCECNRFRRDSQTSGDAES
jgi:hypothetical protein